MKHVLLRFASLVAIAAPAAAAETITFNSSEAHTGGPGYYEVNLDFALPTGFSNALLDITNFTVDDRALLQLNGNIVSNTGIFGPGNGQFSFSQGGPSDPYAFTFGNTSAHADVTGPFVAGLNVFRILINDTNQGIFGNTLATSSTTSHTFQATLTYDVAATGAVPEPATWAMLIGGFGMVGGSMRYRRRRMNVSYATA